MEYTRKTFVQFFYIGPQMVEYSYKEVESREIEKLKIPDDAFAFKFFDLIMAKVTVDGQELELQSEPINFSPMYFYGGKVYTRAEVEQQFADNQELLNAVRQNNLAKVIRTRIGLFMPFMDEDIVVPIPEKKAEKGKKK